MSDSNPTAVIVNRAILLTAPGSAAIAVVRLLGPNVPSFLQQHFSRPTPLARCIHGQLHDGARIIDDPVIVLMSPQSADVNLHGGPWVVKSFLDLAKANGFEIQTPDAQAFPESASILWQETLSHLPLARTESATRMLLAQPAAWDKFKIRAAAGSVTIEELRLIQQDRSLHWMLSLPTVAIIGPANVGKSTLTNALFGQERSITADQPGTTRDWVGEIANIGGLAIKLIDTAGHRATQDPIETAAIAAGNEQIGVADLALLVLDQSTPLGELERELLSAFPHALRIANKADQTPAWLASELNAIETVAVNAKGIDRVEQAILNHFHCGDSELSSPRCWTTRQRDIIDRSVINQSLLTEL